MTIIVCTDLNGGICVNCDGAFAIPGTQFCTIECRDDFEDRRAAERARLTCCPSCGFDQCEHAADCERGTATPEGER